MRIRMNLFSFVFSLSFFFSIMSTGDNHLSSPSSIFSYFWACFYNHFSLLEQALQGKRERHSTHLPVCSISLCHKKKLTHLLESWRRKWNDEQSNYLVD